MLYEIQLLSRPLELRDRRLVPVNTLEESLPPLNNPNQFGGPHESLCTPAPCKGDNAPAHTVINSDGTTTWPYSAGTPAVITWSKWNQNAALVVPYSGAFRWGMQRCYCNGLTLPGVIVITQA